jgi:hypothetical protein
MNESQWVRRRRELVDDFVQNRTLIPALLENRKLAIDTLLALRDEVKGLRDEVKKLQEHLTPTRREGDGD